MIGYEERPRYVLCHCDCGEMKSFGLANLTAGRTRSCRGPAHLSPNQYAQAHRNIRKSLGPASGYRCWLRCGAAAEEWAYDHTDPNERRDVDGLSAGIPYSMDPTRYVALCKSCHVKFDKWSTSVLRKLPPTKQSQRLARIWLFLHNQPGARREPLAPGTPVT